MLPALRSHALLGPPVSGIEQAAAHLELRGWNLGNRVARVGRFSRRRDRRRRREVEAADETIVGFGQRLLDLPSQPEVQRQVGAHAPVVVRVERRARCCFSR